MGCNCGGSQTRKQRGSTGSARQQPGFWAPPKVEPPKPAAEK